MGMVKALLAVFLGALLLLSPVFSTFASSDVGFSIQRGQFSVTVRYSMFLGQSSDDERFRLDLAFRELAQWVWENRHFLEQQKTQLAYTLEDLKDDGGGALARNDDEAGGGISFTRGKMGQAIIQDLSRQLNIKATTPPAMGPAKLKAVYFKLANAPEMPNDGDVFIGAFPGRSCDWPLLWLEALGRPSDEYDCGLFFWSDHPLAPTAPIEILEIPLTAEFIRKHQLQGP
jgi:hypothetical protein